MNKLFSLLALAALSAPAAAEDNYAFYGSIGAGAYRVRDAGFDDVAPMANLLGGYSFNNYVAVEGAYTRFFESSERAQGIKLGIDGNVWDLSTKLSYPVTNRFSPYARLGWSYLDLNAVLTDGDTRLRTNGYDDAFNWAVGSGFRLTNRLELNGEYSKIMVKDGDLDRMALNLNYRFGSRQ